MNRILFGAVSLSALCGLASAQLAVFPDSVLGTPNGTSQFKSYTDNGVTLNVSTADGDMSHIGGSGGFAGLWFSQNLVSDGTYVFDFNGLGATSFTFAVDAISAVGDAAREVLSNFTVTGGTPSYVVTPINNMDIGGTDLASLTLACVQGLDNGEFSMTITSPTPFTSVSFRHTQDLFQNGSVIEYVEVNAVPAPASAGLLAVAGLAALRRRR